MDSSATGKQQQQVHGPGVLAARDSYFTILEALKINDSDVLNVYNFGSWLLGSNTPTSDRDIILITNNSATPLKFKQNSDRYFHQFKLYTLEINSTKFDVVVYNRGQFEQLLECHFLVCLDCIFAPPDFIWKNTVDFRSFFLEHFNEAGIVHALQEELRYSLGVYQRSLDKDFDQKVMAVKKLFNIVRYYHTSAQILRHHTIVDYGECNALKPELLQLLTDSQGDLAKVRAHIQKYLTLRR